MSELYAKYDVLNNTISCINCGCEHKTNIMLQRDRITFEYFCMKTIEETNGQTGAYRESFPRQKHSAPIYLYMRVNPIQ